MMNAYAGHDDAMHDGQVIELLEEQAVVVVHCGVLVNALTCRQARPTSLTLVDD